MSSALCNFKPPLMIDFSIEKSIGVTNAQKIVAESEHKQDAPPPEIKQVPPAPKRGAEIQKVVAEIEHKQVVPVPEIKPVTPALNPLPKREKVVIRKDVEPLVPKKVIVEKKVPKLTESVEIPDLIAEKKVVPEKIEKKSKASEEILPDQTVAFENSAADDLKKSPSAKTYNPVVVPVVSKSTHPPKERYLKENFLYIKESVQSKIVYPRIARKMGWQGRVLISFVICKDGSVKDIRIVESSGFKALDNNAVKVIREVAPFPKPPVSAEIIIPVTYRLS